LAQEVSGFKNDMGSEKFVKMIQNVIQVLENEATTLKTQLLNQLQQEVNNKFGEPELYTFVKKNISDYSAYVNSIAKAKIEMRNIEADRDDIRYKIEHLKFKLQKSDFNNNYDYVFPSELIIGLKIKKKQIDNMIEGIQNEEASYFDPSDPLFQQSVSDQEALTSFFAAELEDLMKTKERLTIQLELAMKIDEIEAQIDFRLGEYLGRAHLVTVDKTCFSLGEISYFIFTMIKTNVVVKELDFFKGFFSQLSEITVKEFVIYNYMLLTTEEYVDHVIDSDPDTYTLNKKSAEEVFSSKLVKNFVSNYVMIIGYYRDMTEFSRAEENAKQTKETNMFCRSIIAIAMTFVQGKLTEAYEDEIKGIIDAVSLIITVAIPFLHAIPFAKKLISLLLNLVIGKILQMLSIFANFVYTTYQDRNEKKMQTKLQEEAAHSYLFDVDRAIEQARDVQKAPEPQAKFDTHSNMKLLEKKFLDILNDDDNVFNKLESLHIFRDSNLEENRMNVFNMNKTSN
jgi:hypothetical protein